MPHESIELTTFKKSPNAAELVVTGNPNPAALLAQVTRHETKHATDIGARRDAILKTWDQAATQATVNQTEYTGASEPAAREALWAAFGGTPAAIAKSLDDRWSEDSDTYHASGAGKTNTAIRYDPELITVTVSLTA
jgi:hypothetical protein